MKNSKLFTIILALIAFIPTAWAQGLSGSGTTQDPYLITSDTDWTTFAQSVTDGTNYAGQTVKLTADITATVMAGSHTNEYTYHAFSGTFDGDKYTITLDLSGSGEGIALFSDIEDATLKNLRAQGTVTTTDRRPATFAVFVAGNSTINKCWSTVAVSSTRANSWVDGGGFVGRVRANDTLNMSDCAFYGSVTYDTTAYSGGSMVGFTQAGATVNLTNCLYSPTALTLNVSAYNPHVFVSGDERGNLTNCYYNAVAAASILENEGTNATGMTNEDLAEALGEGWHEYNGMVVPFSRKYYISSAAEWDAFVTAVNNGTSYSGQIVALTNNIPDILEVIHGTTAVTTMAGTESHPFCGTFDGQRHTLTFSLTSNATYCAPFRYTDGATIKNLKTDGSINASNKFASGMVGQVQNNGCTFTNCVCDVDITSSVNGDATNGGFVGYIYRGSCIFEGCAFTGKLLGANATYNGGFVGFTDSNYNATATFTNCLFHPEQVTMGDDGSQTFARWRSGNSSVIIGDNCYYSQTFGAAQGKLMHSITAGEYVTAAINGEASAYNTSGISAYSVGMVYDSTLYAGEGDTLSLYLDCTLPSGYFCSGFSVSEGTLNGTENSYTLAMPNADVTIQAVLELLPPVAYIDENGETQECTIYTVLTGGNAKTYPAGWYVVRNDINFTGQLSFTGDAHIILCDSTTMTINNSTNPPSYSISVEGNLTIYGQSGGTGTLSAPFSTYIGLYTNEGNVEINGGIVTLCGAFSGLKTNGGDVIIRGGVVTVTANGPYGINSYPGNVSISGDTVTSIGSAYGIFGTDVNISGGKVTATGSAAYGIYCFNIIISGGEVTTLGAGYGICSSGDGSTNGNLTISGGKVMATGSGASGISGFNTIITGGEVTATNGSGIGDYGIYGYNVIISDGIVTASGNRSGIYSYTNLTNGSITISGGTVTTSGNGSYGIYGPDIIISGGEVTANGYYHGIYSTDGSITISGGKVSASGYYDGISASGDITLGWTNPDDYILASGYNTNNGIVAVMSGQAFYYENEIDKHLIMDTVVISGTLTSEEISAIAGKTLRPYIESTTVTQTIELAAGTNWVSFNVEITLDDLKAALVATGYAPITIQSKDDGLTTYNGTRWRGSLSTLDVAQMYMVTVETACEIELEGAPVNPADHPVIIHNGANWIAFPLSESMTITNAFAGFDVVSGDVVNSKSNGLATYTNRWRGTLTTLVPGQGYIYNSAATEDRVLTFPTSAK